MQAHKMTNETLDPKFLLAFSLQSVPCATLRKLSQEASQSSWWFCSCALFYPFERWILNHLSVKLTLLACAFEVRITAKHQIGQNCATLGSTTMSTEQSTLCSQRRDAASRCWKWEGTLLMTSLHLFFWLVKTNPVSESSRVSPTKVKLHLI